MSSSKPSSVGHADNKTSPMPAIVASRMFITFNETEDPPLSHEGGAWKAMGLRSFNRGLV
jgi:hypothetical protein